MKISDISKINPIEFERMSYQDLLRVARPLIDATNKRLKRMEQEGLSMASQAFRAIGKEKVRVLGTDTKSKGKVVKITGRATKTDLRISYAPVKGLGEKRNEELLRAKVQSAYRFMFQSKTGSLRGTRRVYTEAQKKLGIKFKSKSEARKFWEAFHKMQESATGGSGRYRALHGYSSLSVQDALEIYRKGMKEHRSVDEIVDLMEHGFDERYSKSDEDSTNEKLAELFNSFDDRYKEDKGEDFDDEGFIPFGRSEDF